MRIKYTKELLAGLVSDSTSVAQVIRKLGLKEAGGNHSHINSKIKKYGLDTSHFLGQGANCGKNYKGGKKKTWDKVLVLRENGPRYAAVRLRRALIEYGREYKCELCGLGDMWNGKLIRLEVDHINNNWLDNRPQSIRFCCPNCHSQQPHKGNQGFTGLTSMALYNRVLRSRKGRVV